MATLEELGSALKNAHAAGDVEAARKLANAIQTYSPQPEPTEDTSLFGYIPETAKAIAAGGAGMIESALTGASFILPEEAEQAARRKIAEVGGGVQEFLAPDEAYEGTYLDLMRGVGSTLPFLAAAPFGAPGIIAGAAVGVGAGAGEAAQRAEAAGATEEEISTAAGYGMIPGALEMIGPTRIIRRAQRALGPNTGNVADALNNSFKARLGRVSEGKLGRITKAAMDEAAQEASAEVLQNLISQGVYDPDTGTFEGVGESAKIGGGVGAILALFTEMIVPGRQRGPTPQEPAAPEEPAPEEPAAPEPTAPAPTEGDLLGRQDEPTVLSADDLQALGLNLDRATTEKLFGLDLSNPEQRAEARSLLTKYRNNAAVQASRPETVSRIDSLLRSEIFQEPEVAAEPETAPEQIDIEEQIAADVTTERAKEEVATVQQEMELGEADRRVAERRQRESVEKRKQVLEPILERQDIDGVENLKRAFSAELGRQGFTDTEPTQDELAAITRRSYEQEQAAGVEAEQEAVETAQAEEQAAGVAELEALIPERRQRPIPVETTEQDAQRAEAARLNRERMDRTGRGTEGQLEFPAIERAERAAARAPQTEEVVEEAPKVRKADKRFFDRLGVAPQAPVRKQVRGMDVTSEEVRTALTNLGRNRNVSEQTKININNFLQETPEAAPQQDLFAPARPRPTALQQEQARIQAEKEAAKAAPPTARKRKKTTKTKKVEKQQERQKRIGRAPAPEAFAQQPQLLGPLSPTDRDLFATDEALARYAKVARNANNLLATIAYDSTVARHPEVAKAEADTRKVARKAIRAIRDKGSPELLENLNQHLRYQTFLEDAVNRRDSRNKALESLRGTIAGTLFTGEQESQTKAWNRTGWWNSAEAKAPREVIQVDVDQAIKDGIVDGNVQEIVAESEVENGTVENPEGLEGLQNTKDLLVKNAVAASMPEVSETVNDLLLDNNIGGALDQIARDNPNTDIARTARTLAERLRGTGTAVEFAEGVVDRDGKPAPSAYDFQNDVIQINLDMPVSTHAVLHESAHAATHSVLSNPNHPVTIKLQKLYSNLKDKLPNAYAMAGLREFAAEVYSNTEFKAQLAAYKPSGKKRSAWRDFLDAVARFLGFNIDATNATTKALEYINVIMATEPNTRDATSVVDNLTNGDVDEAMVELTRVGRTGLDKKTKEEAYESFLTNINNKNAKFMMNAINGLGLEAIVDMSKGKLPTVEEMQDILYDIDGTRNEEMKTFTMILKDILGAFSTKAGVGVDSAALEKFSRLVSESTIDGIDVTRPRSYYAKHRVEYGTQDLQKKEQLFDTKEKAEEFKKKLEDERREAKKAGKTTTIGTIRLTEATQERTDKYDELKALMLELNSSQRAAYTKMRDMYKNINDKILEAEDANINQLELDPNVQKTVREVLFRKRLDVGVVDPYFRLYREGEYWIQYEFQKAGVEGTEFGYASFDNPGDRQVFADRLSNDPTVININPTLTADQMRSRIINGQLPISLVTTLKADLEGIFKDLELSSKEDKAAIDRKKGEIQDFLADIVLKSLPEQSIVQARQERRGFAGFEADPIYTFEKSMPAFINSYANIKHKVKLQSAANRVMEEGRQAELAGDTFMKEVAVAVAGSKADTDQQFGKLPSYAEFSKNPYLNEHVRLARSLTFMSTIGLGVSSVAVNVSIIPVVLQSRLAGEYGGLEATKATLKAINLYAGTWGKVKREGLGEVTVDANGDFVTTEQDRYDHGGFAITNEFEGEKAEKYKNFAPLITRIKDMGFDTRSIAAETSDPDSPSSPFINKLSYVMSFMFHHSERGIRQVSAMSTYILEMEKLTGEKFDSITEEDIAKYGEQASRKATDVALWVNASALLTTGSRFGQTNLGSLVMQFKRVPGQFLYTQIRMLDAVFKDMTGAARTEAEIEEARVLRNTFMWLTGTGATLIGVKGVPLYGVAMAIWNMFLDDDEDDANTIVAKTLGPEWYYGAIANMFGVDLTDRINLTNLLIRDRGNYVPSSELEYWLEAIGGPTLGVGMRYADGVTDLFDGNPQNINRAFEKVLPTAISNGLKAYRFRTEGYDTTRGDPMISGEIPMGDVIAQGLGFAPFSTRRARDAAALNNRLNRGIQTRRSNLLNDFAYAHKIAMETGDYSLRDEVEEDIKEFNDDHPERPISGKNLRQSLTARARGTAIAELTRGAIVDRRFIEQAEENYRLLYGEE